MLLHGANKLGARFFNSPRGSEFLSIVSSMLDHKSCILTNIQLNTAFRSLHSLQKQDFLPSIEDNADHLFTFGGNGPVMANHPKLTESMENILWSLNHHLQRRKQSLTAPMVATALYGLQHCSANYPVVQQILEEFTHDLEESKESISSQNIANALLGLKSMSSSSNKVRKLCRALAAVIDRSPVHLSAQTVGNGLYGMQNLDNYHYSTCMLLAAMNKKIMEMEVYSQGDTNTEKMFTGQHIGNALWGLRRMTANAYKDRDIVIFETISLLLPHIHASKEEMSGQNLANAYYALQHIDARHRATKALLSVLAMKLLATTQPISGQDFAMALYGLRAMDTDIVAVQLNVRALLYKLEDTKLSMTRPELTLSILGLLHCPPWLKDSFLKTLAKKADCIATVDIDNCEDYSK
jgi:hypothetical protein